MGGYYFLACLLPPLPSILGDKLPLPFADLCALIRRNIQFGDEGLLKAELSLIDAANWEHFDQGQEIFLTGGTLSREELGAWRNLPPFIHTFLEEKERGVRRPYLYDRLWELCYRELLAEAGRKGCRFLLDYIPWEIALRNRLSVLRMRDSGRNAEEYAVLPALRSADAADPVTQVEGHKNPLAAEHQLDRCRLRRIVHCQGSDPFSLDTLLAFVLQAMIYERWERLQEPYDIKQYLYGGG
jgi:hypothetical protein